MLNLHQHCKLISIMEKLSRSLCVCMNVSKICSRKDRPILLPGFTELPYWHIYKSVNALWKYGGFLHLFKEIKEKYIKLFLHHFHLYSFKYIIQNHPIIEWHNTVYLTNIVIKSSIKIFKYYMFVFVPVDCGFKNLNINLCQILYLKDCT
jgi:hypothetical protein